MAARALAAVLAAVATLAAPAAALAHSRTRTYAEIRVDGRDVTWRLRIRTADLAQPLGLSENAGVAEVRSHPAEVLDYVGRRLAVFNHGGACGEQPGDVLRDPLAPEPSVSILVRWRCARAVEVLRLRYELFFDLDVLHQGFAEILLPGKPDSAAVFRTDLRELTLAREIPVWRSALEFVVLGVEHILTGHDHLAFLAALLLAIALRPPGGALRDTVKIVTAFTLAHSITLIFAALRGDAVSTRVVEPAIALSVCYVGVENLFASRAGSAPLLARRRSALVFAFGLVHGLGFASSLRETGLPTRGLVACLLSFNLGVELGQLAVVAIVLPSLLACARRSPHAYRRIGLRGASALIAAAGFVWFALRIR